ncbi:MAG: low temperature requirement protein A [Gaiellaceae bacterium]
MAQREQRVTPLEIFFDLVFVYAITQVTLLMSDDPTWNGVGRGLLVLAALWWAWTGYAWLTNTLEPEEGLVRAGVLAAMAAMLVVALAVPEAFGANAVLFGVAYLIVRLLQLLLFAIAGRRDPDLGRVVLRKAPSATLGPVIIVAAGFFDGPAQAALWVVALAVDYLGALIGHGEGLRVSPAHFAERYGLVVIIALGESIVAIGVGAAGEAVTTGIVAAAVLGILVIGALWWAYFDVYAVEGQRVLSQASGAARFRLARDAYSYLHLPLIAGIVLFALGLKKTIEQVDDPLETVPAVALCGGLALYFLSYVAFRVRLVHHVRRATSDTPPWISRARSITAVALLALLPVASEFSALTTLALATGVCCALIAYDVIHYREDRPRVRAARP